MILELHESN